MASDFPDASVLPVSPGDAAAAPVPGPSSLEEELVALFDTFREPLLRYLSNLGLTFQDGEEVLQEVFLALFQHLKRGRSRANLRGWLFRVAHNMALKRRFRIQRAFEMGGTQAEDFATDPHPNPEERMSTAQTQRRLWGVVDALPEQDRRCLFLRAEGLRYREIAGVLDISLGAVSLSLARSLARLVRASKR